RAWSAARRRPPSAPPGGAGSGRRASGGTARSPGPAPRGRRSGRVPARPSAPRGPPRRGRRGGRPRRCSSRWRRCRAGPGGSASGAPACRGGLARSAELRLDALLRLLLGDVEREAQLRHEDAARLDEHRLLAGGEALGLLAQGEVPDDLGDLVHVAGLELLLVVLE